MTADYAAICFVVMPFGTKSVLRWKVPFLPLYFTRKVDFDQVYADVFRPAIEAVELPEGGKLLARRADEDFFSALISDEVCDYLEYSRIVLADITGLNPNVVWELGVRHRARSAGTVVFRQLDTSLPFDLSQIRAFPYGFRPRSEAEKSRKIVAKILEESLTQLKRDSPVRLALDQQQRTSQVDPRFEELLRDAERSLNRMETDETIGILEDATTARLPGALVHVRLAVLYREKGSWKDVEFHARAAIEIDPRFSEAHRELGIALNKAKGRNEKGATHGEPELRHAIELDPRDYDAYASLAGALRRDGKSEAALELYRAAADLSGGHPYPVLNELKTAASLGRQYSLDERQRELIERGALLRESQIRNAPPTDVPWSLFDLGEIRFHQGRSEELPRLTARGIAMCTALWQVTTHLEGLQMLARAAGVRDDDRAHLQRAIQHLRDAAAAAQESP
jgi:tetratricopeptide (TPR) repeat protein